MQGRSESSESTPAYTIYIKTMDRQSSDLDNGPMSDQNVLARGCAFSALVGAVQKLSLADFYKDAEECRTRLNVIEQSKASTEPTALVFDDIKSGKK